jgi:hypothetical protein
VREVSLGGLSAGTLTGDEAGEHYDLFPRLDEILRLDL